MDDEPTSHPSFSAPQRWGILFSVALGIVAFLAIAVMTNYLALRYPQRFALSPRAETQLHQPTLNLLKSVTNRIEIIVLFDKEDSPDMYSMVRGLLKEYAQACPYISVSEISPIADFARAALTLKKYNLEAQTLTNRNFVVLATEGGARARVVNDDELGELDYDQLINQRSREVGLKNFKGEIAFTSAIMALMNPRKPKVYFLQGHREHDPDATESASGYGRFATLLKEQLNFQCEKLELLGTNEVPADCQVLIIAGPRAKYQESDLAKIQAYLKRGGRALVLMNNRSLDGEILTGIEDVLEMWNVRVEDNMVFDPGFAPNGSQTDLFVAAMNPDHPAIKPLLRLDDRARLWLCLPRPVGLFRNTARSVDAPKVIPLATTSTNGSYETKEVRQGVPYRNQYRDRKDLPFPLMVAVEQVGIPGVRTERDTRMIVVGDSLCLANERIKWQPNAYFASLAVNWLADRPQEILNGLVPRPLKQYRLALTQQDHTRLQWLLLAAIPGGVLLFGSMVWLRRRS